MLPSSVVQMYAAAMLPNDGGSAVGCTNPWRDREAQGKVTPPHPPPPKKKRKGCQRSYTGDAPYWGPCNNRTTTLHQATRTELQKVTHERGDVNVIQLQGQVLQRNRPAIMPLAPATSAKNLEIDAKCSNERK